MPDRPKENSQVVSPARLVEDLFCETKSHGLPDRIEAFYASGVAIERAEAPAIAVAINDPCIQALVTELRRRAAFDVYEATRQHVDQVFAIGPW